MIEPSMQLIGNPHIFSNLILSFTGVFVFLRYFGGQPDSNRALWGVYLLGVSLGALSDLLYFAGIERLGHLRTVMAAGEMTMGAVCLVLGSWCLIMNREASKMLFGGALFLGGALLYCIVWFHVEYAAPIVKAFCIVVTLLICCLGLGSKQKSALWIIIAMMLIALSTKSGLMRIPFHPLEISHYMTVSAILCIGFAVRDERKVLF